MLIVMGFFRSWAAGHAHDHSIGKVANCRTAAVVSYIFYMQTMLVPPRDMSYHFGGHL